MELNKNQQVDAVQEALRFILRKQLKQELNQLISPSGLPAPGTWIESITSEELRVRRLIAGLDGKYYPDNLHPDRINITYFIGSCRVNIEEMSEGFSRWRRVPIGLQGRFVEMLSELDGVIKCTVKDSRIELVLDSSFTETRKIRRAIVDLLLEGDKNVTNTAMDRELRED